MSATHKYTGPRSPWGLRPGMKVQIVGKRAGGYSIKLVDSSDHRTFTVGKAHVEKIEPKKGR